MKKRKIAKAVVIVMVILMGGMTACGGGEPKKVENKMEKMKPKNEDRLNTLMARAWDNLTFMMYGFMNYDASKIEVSSKNLVEMSPLMAQRIGPQHRKYKAQWNDQCDRQQQLAANIEQQFASQNFEEAIKSFGDLLAVCMDCHKIYRKHLFSEE